MSDTAVTDSDQSPKKGGLKPILFGVIAACVLGGAGFFAAYSGLLGGGGNDPAKPTPTATADLPVFVPVPQLMISFSPDNRTRMLRFSAELEVDQAHKSEVEKLIPRINDVFNTYLRAVDLQELEAPTSMLRMRAQLLRRVQIVTGPGRVRDLLVTEFILS